MSHMPEKRPRSWATQPELPAVGKDIIVCYPGVDRTLLYNGVWGKRYVTFKEFTLVTDRGLEMGKDEAEYIYKQTVMVLDWL